MNSYNQSEMIEVLLSDILENLKNNNKTLLSPSDITSSIREKKDIAFRFILPEIISASYYRNNIVFSHLPIENINKYFYKFTKDFQSIISENNQLKYKTKHFDNKHGNFTQYYFDNDYHKNRRYYHPISFGIMDSANKYNNSVTTRLTFLNFCLYGLDKLNENLFHPYLTKDLKRIISVSRLGYKYNNFHNSFRFKQAKTCPMIEGYNEIRMLDLKDILKSPHLDIIYPMINLDTLYYLGLDVLGSNSLSNDEKDTILKYNYFYNCCHYKNQLFTPLIDLIINIIQKDNTPGSTIEKIKDIINYPLAKSMIEDEMSKLIHHKDFENLNKLKSLLYTKYHSHIGYELFTKDLSFLNDFLPDETKPNNRVFLLKSSPFYFEKNKIDFFNDPEAVFYLLSCKKSFINFLNNNIPDAYKLYNLVKSNSSSNEIINLQSFFVSEVKKFNNFDSKFQTPAEYVHQHFKVLREKFREYELSGLIEENSFQRIRNKI